MPANKGPFRVGQDNQGLLEIIAPGIEGCDTIAYMTGEDDLNIDIMANAYLLASSHGLLEALELLYEDWLTLADQDLNEKNKDAMKINTIVENIIKQAKGI